MRVFWLDTEKTTLVREFSKDWDWHDYRLCLQEMRRMLASVDHEVLVLLDCRQLPWLTRNRIAVFNKGHYQFLLDTPTQTTQSQTFEHQADELPKSVISASQLLDLIPPLSVQINPVFTN